MGYGADHIKHGLNENQKLNSKPINSTQAGDIFMLQNTVNLKHSQTKNIYGPANR